MTRKRKLTDIAVQPVPDSAVHIQPPTTAQNHDHAHDDDTDTKPDPQAQGAGETQPEGDSTVAVMDAPHPAEAPRTRETRRQATNRWCLEGRTAEVELFRDEVRKACIAKGMPRYEANERAWESSLSSFPPPDVEPESIPIPEAQPPPEPAGEVAGVYLVPDAWPQLPNNASLQAEVAWVQGERLRVVQTRGNVTTVRLELASTPAPSMAALSWLETSIRSYAKYIDVVSRALATQADDQEHERRERMALDEIDSMLRALCDDEQGAR